jgi:hypothetical protein
MQKKEGGYFSLFSFFLFLFLNDHLGLSVRKRLPVFLVDLFKHFFPVKGTFRGA